MEAEPQPAAGTPAAAAAPSAAGGLGLGGLGGAVRWRWGLPCLPLRCPIRRLRREPQPHLSDPLLASSSAANAAAAAPASPASAAGAAMMARSAAEEPARAETAAAAVTAEAEERMCRYCFEGDEAGELISPCRCAGGQKYVHLTCLRSWQRTVLVSQPTHPDLYDSDTRQRICNVCKSEFTCPPPTRAELLATFTGPELAALIDEGCIIASAEDFSWELEQQVMNFPEAMWDSIVYRNWVRGVFVIVKVVEDRERECVLLRVNDEDDLERFLEHLGDNGETFHLRGRRFSVLPQGPLRDVADMASPTERLVAMRGLQPPLTFRLRPDPAADCGEDGIVAVNLTRPFDLATGRGPMDSHRRASYCEALRQAGMSSEDLSVQVSHFLAGPCEEDQVSACFVVAGGKYAVLREPDCLPSAIRAAEAASRGTPPPSGWATAPPGGAAAADRGAGDRAQGAADGGDVDVDVDGAGAAEGEPLLPTERPPPGAAAAADAQPPAHATDGDDSGMQPAAAAAGSPAGGAARKRRRLAEPAAAAEAAEAAEEEPRETASAEEDEGEPVRLFVFWGYAGWSRCQLMGEIARGSWGLCRGETGDVVSTDAVEVWRSVYPRLIFAPKSEMSETYSGQAPQEEERRRELRRMAIFHDLLRGRSERRAAAAAADTAAAREGGGGGGRRGGRGRGGQLANLLAAAAAAAGGEEEEEEGEAGADGGQPVTEAAGEYEEFNDEYDDDDDEGVDDEHDEEAASSEDEGAMTGDGEGEDAE